METVPDLTHTIPSGTAAGYLSNAGTDRYLLEAESTTGYVAWKLSDGTILVNAATQISLPASPSVCFWACAGYQDTTPAGEIISFDCHGNSLAQLSVTALTSLQYLDVSFNCLRELSLDGLTELEALDADNNDLSCLEVKHLHGLRVLNCAFNRLTALDLSGLEHLQILDCSHNQIVSLHLDGCTSLQDTKYDGNRLKA